MFQAILDFFHDFPQRVLQRLRIPGIQVRSYSCQHTLHVGCCDGARSSLEAVRSLSSPSRRATRAPRSSFLASIWRNNASVALVSLTRSANLAAFFSISPIRRFSGPRFICFLFSVLGQRPLRTLGHKAAIKPNV